MSLMMYGKTQARKNNISGLEIQHIPVERVVFGKYQRGLSESRARQIAREFDINRMQPISVSERDGKYYAYDGQHRTRAYEILGFTHIPAIVRRGLTYAEEATYFAKQSENVGAITKRNTWNAKVEAKDPTTMRMINIPAKHGYVVEWGGRVNPRNVYCLRSLEQAYSRLDESGYDRIFIVIEEAFGNAPKATACDIIEGLTEFIATYDNDPKAVSPVDWNRVYKVLSTVRPADIICEANGYRIGNYAKSSNAASALLR